MANPNADPTKARMARSASVRLAGDIVGARQKLWKAITKVESVMDDPTTQTADILRAVHALTQSVSVFARLVEGTELERRLAEIEARLAASPANREALP